MVVDTTARAVIRMQPGKQPDLDTVNAALDDRRLKVKKLTKASFTKALEVYTLNVKGLG